jgi:hypothetical protein
LGESKSCDRKELAIVFFFFSSGWKLETMGQERLNVAHRQNTAVRHAWWLEPNEEDEINK